MALSPPPEGLPSCVFSAATANNNINYNYPTRDLPETPPARMPTQEEDEKLELEVIQILENHQEKLGLVGFDGYDPVDYIINDQ